MRHQSVVVELMMAAMAIFLLQTCDTLTEGAQYLGESSQHRGQYCLSWPVGMHMSSFLSYLPAGFTATLLPSTAEHLAQQAPCRLL